MLIIKQKFIFREDLKNNPDILYIFGDNMKRQGMGGQAKEMRGERNAYGIATKMKPEHGTPDCYFYDEQKYFEIVDREFARLKEDILWNISTMNRYYSAIVIPSDGIGTGLALLNENAPKLLAHINEKLEELKYVDFK